jgi:N-acetylglucosaminyl-diphospho-decaprenol L-rhamnosyltransferase
MPPGRLDLSVIIPSWNVGNLLKAAVKSVLSAEEGLTLELVVVDNASSDPEVTQVRADFAGLRWIQNESNQGFAAACNRGIAAASGRYLLLLNNDCVVLPGTLRGMVQFMDDRPQAGVGSCMLLDREGGVPLGAGCRFLPSLPLLMIQGLADSTGLLWLLRRLGVAARLFGNDLDPYQVQQVAQVSGAFFMIRREALEEIGLLDDGYFLYLEETDYCTRLAQHGWSVLYNPAVQAYHRCSASSQLRSDREAHHATSMARYLRRYRGPLSSSLYLLLESLFFRPLRRVRDLIRSLIRPVQSRGQHAGRT